MKYGIIKHSIRASSVGYFLQKLYVDCSKKHYSRKHFYRLKLKNRLALYGVDKMGGTLIPQMAVEQTIKQNPELSVIHLNEPSPTQKNRIYFPT